MKNKNVKTFEGFFDKFKKKQEEPKVEKSEDDGYSYSYFGRYTKDGKDLPNNEFVHELEKVKIKMVLQGLDSLRYYEPVLYQKYFGDYIFK